MGYQPGLRIHRRIGESWCMWPRIDPEDKTTFRLYTATGGIASVEISSDVHAGDTHEWRVGDSETFGQGETEAVVVLDHAGGSYATFRVMAGPEVVIKRREEMK